MLRAKLRVLSLLPSFADISARLNRLAAACLCIGLIATTVLSLIPPSTSQMQVWPWSLLTVLTWTTWILAGSAALAANGRLAASMTGVGLLMLGIIGVLSAHTAFLPGISKPAALPILAGCLVPFAFESPLRGNHRRRWLTLLGLSGAVVMLVSFHLWLTTRVGPAFASGQNILNALAARNDQPFGHSNYVAAFSLLAMGAMVACLIGSTHRWVRLGWCVGTLVAAVVLFSTGSRAGLVALAFGLASFAFLSVKAGVRPSRRQVLIIGIGVCAVVAAGIAANPRLRELVLSGHWGASSQESNQQRLGMSQAAVALGLERPWLGWGPGSVPQVFPSVRSTVAGNVDNVIQVHSSLLQTLATLGVPGMIAVVLVAAGLLSRLLRLAIGPARFPSNDSPHPPLEGHALSCPGVAHDPHNAGPFASIPSRPHIQSTDQSQTGHDEACPSSGYDSPRVGLQRALENASLASGLIAFLAYSFFDHSLDIPAMAMFAGAAVGATGFSGETSPPRTGLGRAAAFVALASALLLTAGTYRDQVARKAFSNALTCVVHQDPSGFRNALLRADKAVPDSTYASHVLASWLATGQPFTNQPPLADKGAAAIPPLEASLVRNPFLEYAHYNLGWLQLENNPAKAERHFLAAALLAPHRIGVHLGIGLARIAQGNATGAAAAFAAEQANDPRQAFQPLFREPSLAGISSQATRLAENFLSAQAKAGHLDAGRVDDILAIWHDESLRSVAMGKPFRRVRPGYGVLMGFPGGRPPADVNVMSTPALTSAIEARLPKPGWINGELLLKLALDDASLKKP